MEINTRINNKTCDITLDGKFTFADHSGFREILQKIADEDVKEVSFHMEGLEFVDSAALGMMLLAADEAKKYQKPISINGATGQVKKMFEMTRFDTLFKMAG